MIFGKFAYVPVLKSTDAELKGFSHVSDEIFDTTVPVFELTKSRITSKNPIGSIRRRIQQLQDVIKTKEFFLDLTVHDDLQNPEIDSLTDETDGYQQWVAFVKSLDFPGLVPVIQLLLGGEKTNIQKQTRALFREFGRAGIRLDSGLSKKEIASLLEPALLEVDDNENLSVFLDAGYVHFRQYSEAYHDLKSKIRYLIEDVNLQNIAVISSSFPKSPAAAGYGDEEEGHFELGEVHLSELALADFGDQIVHGDYAGVHPVRYPSGGGWIPRIDVPLERECFYWRYRREDGGYVRAANKVLDDEYYTEIDAWGDEQIAVAAEGKPEGRSPQHWIAVRVNLHMTRQHKRISG